MTPPTGGDLPPPSAPAASAGPSFEAAGASAAPAGGWAVAAGRGVVWWSEGWRLFTKAPWTWIALTLAFFVTMLVLALIPLIGHLIGSLVVTVLVGGLLLGAQSLDGGGDLTFDHLFVAFRDRWQPLVIAGLLYIAGWLLIWVLAFGLLLAIAGFGTLGAIIGAARSGWVPGDLGTIPWGVVMTLGAAVLAVLVFMLLLSIPLMMAYWFAPPLIVFRNDDPIAAMRASFTASLRNIPALTVYGLLGIVLTIAALIPFGLGLLVLAPVFLCSVYASCKDIFGVVAMAHAAPAMSAPAGRAGA